VPGSTITSLGGLIGNIIILSFKRVGQMMH
jgi:hypothetical protein